MKHCLRLSVCAISFLVVGCPGVEVPVILPVITSFSPATGYQGTLVTIEGIGFSSALRDNHVRIGGVDAIVVTATDGHLEALVGFGATTGPIEVSVAGGASTTTTDSFAIVDWPAAGSGENGPPIFYGGPASGSGAPKKRWAAGLTHRDLPSTGTINVLVVPSYPTDTVPGNLANERQSIVDKWDDVHDFYDQASYGTLNVQTDAANWVQLCGAFND